MDTERVIARLRDLPPSLPTPPDRFERVQTRARRRRRRVVGCAAAGCAGVVLVGALTTLAWAPGETVGRDLTPMTPAQPSEDASRSTPPGGEEVTRLSDPVRATRTGTASVDLGPRPSGTTGLETTFSCLSAGSFRFPDGSSLRCSDADVEDGQSALTSDVIEWESGQSEYTVRTQPDASWRLSVAYVSTRLTDWAVNPSGQTYGVQNENGTPDLVAVVATNGREGYAFATDLESPGGIPQPRTPKEAVEYTKAVRGKTLRTPVYESDGTTRIGVFETRG